MTKFAQICRSGCRLLPVALLLAGHLSAGQSLVLRTTDTILLADPPYPLNQSWRVEFQLHNFALPNTGVAPIIYLASVGMAAYLNNATGQIGLESLGDQVVQLAPCSVTVAGMANALVRFQRDTNAKTVTCEAWNYDSTGYNTEMDNISKLGNLPFGGGFLGNGSAGDLGFLRVYTTLLPAGSRPPVTADSGDWTDLKFDGNLNDSSGHGHGGTALATYVQTPNQVPVALPKTLGAPFWTNWLSLRAGFPAQLDGSNSYTLADGSPTVTYQWQQTSGPSNVVWRNRNSATPTLNGLIFGPYSFELQVTDTAGSTASAPLTLGAVATDANGVVVQANPAADAIFGPMIAFGRNPWSFADERNLQMENLQKNTYATPPSWASNAEAATVNYTFFDPYATPSSAALGGSITATALTIPLANTGTLDLSSLPTQVLVGNEASWEIVRMCSVSGAELNVCYDGRGYHYGYDGTYIRPASAWPAGTSVWQAKVKGAGTHFLTTMCPYGAGWQEGAQHPVTSTGTVTVAPGSTTATGNGTAWDGTQNSLAIGIFAKHGGVPFVFWSYVVAANGTSLTLARPFPSDADPGSYSYSIFSDQRNVVLHYTRPDSTDGYIYFPTSGCESDTDLYLYSGWDNGYAGQRNPTSNYTYMDGAGYVGDFSPNYYDMGLAHYAFYFRSGLQQSLTSARNLEDYWLRYPENAQGDAGGNPRDRSIVGVFAAAVLDGDRASNWSGLRSFAQAGVAAGLRNNCDEDMRESAYQMMWLGLAAQFDPNPTQRASWQNSLSTTVYNRDNGCKRADNSFATAFYWLPGPLQIAATQGSTTATAVNGTFPSNMCYSTASGTAVATNGSALLTGLTGAFVPPAGLSYKLLVGGTMNGARYDLVAQFDYNSPNSITLSSLWPGDSGTVYWSIENNDAQNFILTIAQGPNDAANFGKVMSCTLVDSTHIQLYRPWPSASGTFLYSFYDLVGRGTQPFMAGIKTLQMRYGGQVYSPYQSLDQAIANWVGTTGFDSGGTKGIFYGRIFPQCEPVVTDSGITDVIYRVPVCIENTNNPGAASEARARNSEAQNAMTVMYLGNPTTQNQALGDLFYGGTYGATGYTANEFYTDGLTASNLDNGSLESYKWPGFFFGIGMAHQWPAARLGGVAPPRPRTVYIGLNQAVGSSAQITVTAPSSAKTVFQCGNVSPCAVTVDDRQGTHWFQVQYLSASGKVLAQSDPDLLSDPVQQ